ncbi:MAG TPA: hypothetical protein VD789_00695 [Thermomicrobiales bacterium]|nr:hypothetical protein [Thermomicrobiales bacterium]
MVLVVLRQLSTIPSVIGRLLLLNGRAVGMQWVVPAFPLTLVASWVILVEVDRYNRSRS